MKKPECYSSSAVPYDAIVVSKEKEKIFEKGKAFSQISCGRNLF